MIHITLDTSCFDRNSIKLVEELKNLENLSLVKVWREGYSDIETERWISPDKLIIEELTYTSTDVKSDAHFMPLEIAEDPIKSFEYLERQQGYTLKELNEVHIKIDKIIHPEGFHGKKAINKYIDGKILAKHIVRKRNIFVTKDKRGFINNGKKEKLEEEFPGLKVRILNENLIKELKQLLNK